MIQGITTSVAETSSTQVQSTTSRSIISEESENPLDVLSRAATMVEKSAEIIGGKVSPAPSSNLNKKHIPVGLQCIDRTSSFKERLHPKFRKSSTPDYLVALEVARSLKRQTNSISSIQSDIQSENMDTMPNNNSLQATHEDLPLDMSIKKRPATPPALPPPPPYRFKPQTGSPPTHFMYKSPPPYPATPSPPTSLAPLPPPPTYEDSTVKCTYPTKKTPPAPPPPTLLHQEEEKTKIKEITIITNSSSDPLLDEHFRRSLGADYESLFKKKSAGPDSESSSSSSSASSNASSMMSTSMSSTESTPPKVPDQVVVNATPATSSIVGPAKQNSSDSDSSIREDSNTKVNDPVKAFQEDLQMEGYTVEDHFAKALGDTWIKLQKAEEEKRSKNKSEEKPTLVASS